MNGILYPESFNLMEQVRVLLRGGVWQSILRQVSLWGQTSDSGHYLCRGYRPIRFLGIFLGGLGLIGLLGQRVNATLSYTTNLALCKPSDEDLDWGTCMRATMDTLDNATLKGSTFNAAGQLLQLNSSGKINNNEIGNYYPYLTRLSTLTVEGSSLTVGGAGNFQVLGASVGVRQANPVYAVDVGSGDINAPLSGVYRRAGTAGLDRTCPANQGFSAVASSGGITTAGTCTIFGDAVLSSTQTWTGSNVYNSTATFAGIVTFSSTTIFVGRPTPTGLSVSTGMMWFDTTLNAMAYYNSSGTVVELDPYYRSIYTRFENVTANSFQSVCDHIDHCVASNATESTAYTPIGILGTIVRMFCYTRSNASPVWTLRKLGVSTGMACTATDISGAGVLQGCTATGNVAVTATDIFAIQVTAQNVTSGRCILQFRSAVQ